MSLMDDNYFGGAVLADRSCGSVSFRDASGGDLRFDVGNDPEYTLSGVYEPEQRFNAYGY